jgi:alpha-tubulin suppressor-like RCC1 family protein
MNKKSKLHAMNGYGPFLCFLLFLWSASTFAMSPKPGVWYGTINDYPSNPIMLCVEEGRAAYYYAGQSAEIELDMSDSERWSESVKGKVTGYWNIWERPNYQNTNYLDGVWSNARGKAKQKFGLDYLEYVDSACSSSTYRQTLLIPGEERLSLSLTPDRPAVISGGNSAAILKANGDLWFWGSDQKWPKQVGQGYVRVAIGYQHFLGIKDDGSLWGWGSNAYGQWGVRADYGNPPVHMGDGFVAVAANTESSFAIRKDGTLWAWGGLVRDAKGNPLGEKRAKPILLGKSFVSFAAGEDSYAAIKRDGTLWTWGNNCDGQLGTGKRLDVHSPYYKDEPLPTLIGEDFAQVSMGYSHTAAIKKDGSLWTWGHGTWGDLGNGTNLWARDGKTWRKLRNETDKDRVGLPIKIGDGFSQVVAGFMNTAAVKADGTLWLWGANDGMFGDCTTETHAEPVQVGEGFVQVALAHNFLVALKRDGSEWTLGWLWKFTDQVGIPKACRKLARVVF